MWKNNVKSLIFHQFSRGKKQRVEKSFPFTNSPMKTIINLSISIKIKRARTLPCTVLVEKWPTVEVSEKKSLAKDVAVGQQILEIFIKITLYM